MSVVSGMVGKAAAGMAEKEVAARGAGVTAKAAVSNATSPTQSSAQTFNKNVKSFQGDLFNPGSGGGGPGPGGGGGGPGAGGGAPLSTIIPEIKIGQNFLSG